jgi:Fe-S cluster biogenesis protein NfuA
MPLSLDEIEQYLTTLRPSLQGDNVECVSLEDDTLRIRLSGPCLSCTSSQLEFFYEIRGLLQEKFPALEQVRVV